MKQGSREKDLAERYWALLDVEYIQISPGHRCIRKLYILEENGYIDLELDFSPVNIIVKSNGNINVHFHIASNIYISYDIILERRIRQIVCRRYLY